MKAAWTFIARQMGIPAEEYAAHRNAGELWCSGCREWHIALAFVRSTHSSTGRRGSCPVGARMQRKRKVEFDRIEQLSAEADAKWAGAHERVREMVEHFMAGGKKPGRGMVAL